MAQQQRNQVQLTAETEVVRMGKAAEEVVAEAVLHRPSSPLRFPLQLENDAVLQRSDTNERSSIRPYR